MMRAKIPFSPISLECKLLLSINDMRARLPARFTFHLTPIHPFIYCYSSNGTFSFSLQFSYFSHSVLSDSMPLHGLQHARPPCPLPTHRLFLKFMSIESVMPSNHLILCHPLPLLPSIFPNIRVFSNESALHIRWPKY